MSDSALDHLGELTGFFVGAPITRGKVRSECRRSGWKDADAAYDYLMIQRHPTLFHDPPADPAVEELERFPERCPVSPLPVALPVELRTDEPVAIFSDFHIPAHSAHFIDRAVDKCLEQGVRSFIGAGDLTDNNQVHSKRGLYRQERSWQQDMDLARSVVHHLVAQFPRPDICGRDVEKKHVIFFGNHDEWVLNMTKGQATTDWLYGFIFPWEVLHWTYKRQVRLHQAGRRFMICHGESFSSANPMGVVEKYALNNRMSVITGHMHYAMQWESGPYQLILNGGFFDRTRQDYLHEGPKPMRETQNGFTIIKDGYAKLYAGSDPTW